MAEWFANGVYVLPVLDVERKIEKVSTNSEDMVINPS